MSTPIKSIIIVGGGTAGWITAGTIAAYFKNDSSQSLSVTLIESPNIPIIGVGEGTWPTMRRTLKNMGISETDFFKECNASFKQGAKFAKWVTGEEDDFYYHPLVLPQGFLEGNLAPYWLEQNNNISFSAAVCSQEHLCEQHIAPKQIGTPEYAAVANYAYHLDAGKFSGFLTKHCVSQLGVKHILDDVTDINMSPTGDIKSLSTTNNGELEGDLFIDCTGFKSLLIGEKLGVPFIPKKDTLFIDTALAVQVPYENEDTPIASHTISTAQEAGWIWDIGLSSRRGVGHVFSSDYLSEDMAHKQLRDYLRPRVPDIDSYNIRKIPINSGHRAKFWEKNCVAVGLSAGFLEPLEASALVLVELSAKMIAEQMPTTREAMDIISKRFNTRFLYRWDRIIDFLKLHYVLSKRTDNQFWIDNRDPNTVPDSLLELLELWKYQTPWHHEFSQTEEVFPAASYQYVLYGMGFRTETTQRADHSSDRNFAKEKFNEVMKMTNSLLEGLPTNRELIEKIHSYGMQKI